MTLAIVVAVIAGLYFGREIFVPIALSILLSFALAPPVRWLRRIHVPRIAAVLMVVTLAFMLIAGFAAVVAWQVTDLARGLPTYQRNIEAKIEGFRSGPPGAGVFSRASKMIEDIGRRIDEQEQAPAEAVPPGEAPVANEEAPPPEPIPVEVHQPDPTAIQQLEAVLLPLMSPLATAGVVIVLVIFMLLKREDLRDRVIRLFGSRDLSRTTEALNDAAKRVGHYLLMQLTVNATYGLPIAIGLWFIGVPNPLLWGLLATVLRFVPYIGPVIGAFFPLALALAVEPGWTTFLWAAGLIVVVELISSNAVEPWLYGASTGMSPVAIIAAAIFWTWLWGPIGLLLSTPLTVCLVVLGQHVPQLAFLDVLLGSEAVLTQPETLYQRMIGGDPEDATERAEEYLRTHTLGQYYQNVGIPALAMAESDRVRRTLDEERRDRLTKSFDILMDNLAEHEDVDPAKIAEEDEDAATAEDEVACPPVVPAAGTGGGHPRRPAGDLGRRPRQPRRRRRRDGGAAAGAAGCPMRDADVGEPAIGAAARGGDRGRRDGGDQLHEPGFAGARPLPGAPAAPPLPRRAHRHGLLDADPAGGGTPRPAGCERRRRRPSSRSRRASPP